MWSQIVGLIRRYKTASIAVGVAVAILIAVLVVPRGGGEPDEIAVQPGESPTVPVPGGTGTLPPGGTTTGGVTGTAPGVPGGAATTTGGGGPAGGTTTGGGPAKSSGSIGLTRGVSSTKIRVGVALPDLSAFAAVSENFDVGDQKEQMDAVLDGWKKDGLVPVNGRQIELVYREFDIFSGEEKIAACQQLIQEEKVFTVIGGRFFGEGAQCVTERFKTPLVSVNSELQAVYDRAKPWFFSLRSPWERLFKNYIDWADKGGYLKGKKIGLFYETEVEPAVKVGIIDELKRRGYKITSTVAAEGAGLGTSSDQLAVQQFREDEVDLVIPIVGGTSLLNFTTFAESQGWRPQYLETDYGEHTTDAASSVYPENQYNGTFAMTTTTIGEIQAKMKLSAAVTTCVSHYERFSGNEVGPASPESAEYNNVIVTCDMANAMLAGLRLAGRELGHLSLLRGLESVTNLPMAAHQSLTYGPGRHYGVVTQRTAKWSADCNGQSSNTGCWKAIGSFRPFAV